RLRADRYSACLIEALDATRVSRGTRAARLPPVVFEVLVCNVSSSLGRRRSGIGRRSDHPGMRACSCCTRQELGRSPLNSKSAVFEPTGCARGTDRQRSQGNDAVAPVSGGGSQGTIAK